MGKLRQNSDLNSSSGAWIVTYIDLSLLLLSFFVLLSSMSKLDPARQTLATRSIESTFGNYELKGPITPGGKIPNTVRSRPVESGSLREMAKMRNIEGALASRASDGISLIIGNPKLFNDDGQLQQAMVPYLSRLASHVRLDGRSVEIRGFPGDRSVAKGLDTRYDPWMDSLRRAELVRNVFEKNGIPSNRLTTIGLGVSGIGKPYSVEFTSFGGVEIVIGSSSSSRPPASGERRGSSKLDRILLEDSPAPKNGSSE